MASADQSVQITTQTAAQTAKALHAAAESVKKLGAIDTAADLQASTSALAQTLEKLNLRVEEQNKQSQAQADKMIDALNQLVKATAAAADQAHKDRAAARQLAKMQAHATQHAVFHKIFQDTQTLRNDQDKEILFDILRLYGHEEPTKETKTEYGREVEVRIGDHERLKRGMRALAFLSAGYKYGGKSFLNLSA